MNNSFPLGPPDNKSGPKNRIIRYIVDGYMSSDGTEGTVPTPQSIKEETRNLTVQHDGWRLIRFDGAPFCTPGQYPGAVALAIAVNLSAPKPQTSSGNNQYFVVNLTPGPQNMLISKHDVIAVCGPSPSGGPTCGAVLTFEAIDNP